LRNDEKDLNQEIKRLNDDFKRAQDEYAKEANENNQQILDLKKTVNETKTEKELYVQYRKREIEGKLSTLARVFDKEKLKLKEKIVILEEQLQTENLVSDRIRKFVQAKADTLQKLADKQDKFREKQVDLLEKDRDGIEQKKIEDEAEIQRMHGLIQEEVSDKSKRDQDEKERQQELERKRQEKMDMEDAARYIQRKWKWYQEVGKFLAKKKKKGKKGGKKKK
jgi:hypothetical protein